MLISIFLSLPSVWITVTVKGLNDIILILNYLIIGAALLSSSFLPTILSNSLSLAFLTISLYLSTLIPSALASFSSLLILVLVTSALDFLTPSILALVLSSALILLM